MPRDPADRTESDRAEGAPHPRDALFLFGQDAAEDEFLESAHAGRMHHAWLIAGPRGIGKATLAWRMARFLIGGMPEAPNLDLSPDSPVFRRLSTLAEPRLFLCRRAWDEDRDRLFTRIGIDDIRRLKSFFQLSAADGGWRVAIIDAVDELSADASNALLKILEEPPPRAALLLVAHRPQSVLATIRSRCRLLQLQPLAANKLGAVLDSIGLPAGQDEAALAELASGSAGEAVRIIAGEGLALYARIIACLGGAPRMNRGQILGLASACSGPANAGTYDLIVGLIQTALLRLARHGAGQVPQAEAAAGETAILARLSPGVRAAQVWAECAAMLSGRIAHARAVNLDPAQVILDTFLQIEAAARRAV